MSKKNADAESEKYYVYVIGLDESVLKDKWFRERNKDNYKAGKPCVYVGQSWYTPEERFSKHKEGVKASRIPRRFGLYLQPKLYEKFNPLPSRIAAEKKEKELANALIKKGYGVWCG
jgi:hypothetical protein